MVATPVSIRRSAGALGRGGAGLALGAAVGPPLVRAAAGLGSGPTTAGSTGSLDGVLGAAAEVALLGCLGYAALVLTLSGLTALPRVVGRTATAAVAALTPAVVRRVLVLSLGTGLALAPTATAAQADSGAPRVSPALPAVSLDRPAAPVGPAASAPETVVVRRGDSLWRIAERALGPGASAAEVARSWPRWWAANEAVVGDRPDLIRPGQRLVAPTRRATAPSSEESR